MEIFAEETTSSTTSPRAHSWLLVAVISLFSLHLCYTLTVALYSGIQFLLVWNEIFRIQRPKLLQTELVTQIYHQTLSVDVPSCPICLLDYNQGDVISNGLHCHHMFHNDCLTLWLRKQPSCPCCRLAISEPPPGCTEEEMQEEDAYDPYGTERIWLYIKWSMNLCGFLS